MNKTEQYILDASRTTAPGYYGNDVNINGLLNICSEIIGKANKLDKYKKKLFYNKQDDIVLFERYDLSDPYVKKFCTITETISSLKEDGLIDDKQRFVDILHSIIGIVTESSELLEALCHTLKGEKPLDEVNLKEEYGDLFWYQALGLKVLGETNFDKVLDTNIAKLKARYPEKFTSEHAINRDLETERKILEK